MSNLPIQFQDKENSPALLAYLQQFGEKSYLSAEEINQIRDAINELGQGSLPDAVLKTGPISITGLAVNIAANAFAWRINQQSFLNPPSYGVNLTAAANGFYRADIIVGTSTGTYQVVQGNPSATTAKEPNTPEGTIRLAGVVVFGMVVGQPTPTPITNFIEKSERANVVLTGSGVINQLNLVDEKATIVFNNAITRLNTISYASVPYNGKRITLFNAQATPVTIGHSVSGYGVDFVFPDAQDYVLAPNQTIEFSFDITYAPYAHHMLIGSKGITNWSELQGKPSTFPPSSHTHVVSEITDFPTFKTIEGQSVIGAGNIDLDKNSVGLGNVDNTSDLNKIISTATQTALNAKANISGQVFTGAVSATNLSGTNTGDNAPNSLYSGLVTNATHTGEVTGSTALTITNGAVTNAKLANVATSTLKGRVAATTGVVEDLTASQVRTLLNVADGANNYVHPANHLASIITQDASNRFVTDTEKSAWNAKESAIASGTISQYWRGDKTWQPFPAQATVDQTIIDGSTNAVSGNAVFDALVLKAPLASPALTGTPTAPTAPAGTNTTQIATTDFVQAGLNLKSNLSDITLQRAYDMSTDKKIQTLAISPFTLKAQTAAASNNVFVIENSSGFEVASVGAQGKLSAISASVEGNVTGNLFIKRSSPINNILLAGGGDIEQGTFALASSVHNPVTLGTANGLSLSTQQLSLGLASSGVTGALSGTDWNTFNNKENSFTKNTAFNKNFGITAGTVVEGGTLGSNAYNSTAYLPLSGGTLTGILNIDGVDSPKIFFQQNSSLISLVTNNFGIYGTGSKTDFNTFVYGNNPYGIWTNGVKRVTVGGDGNTTFSGTISASPATTANQVVVKSQLDAVAASSGRYTPTVNVITGVTSVSVHSHTYTKIGNIVTVYGDSRPSSVVSGVAVIYEISLPIARANTVTKAIGFGSVNVAGWSTNQFVRLESSSATTVIISFNVNAAGTPSALYSFQYDITQ